MEAAFQIGAPLTLRASQRAVCGATTFTGSHCARGISPASFPGNSHFGAPGITMKKSRYHAPLRPRPQEGVKIPEDGTPVFSIFVRSPRARIWYPLGAVKGDDKSKTLVNALKNSFARALYANALDKGIAQTVYGKDSGRFVQSALRLYPQLKRSQRELEFGYKVAAKGLEEQETKVVTRDMALPFFSWAKKQFQEAFKPKS